MPQPKIATCCYCGTRAALVLRGKVRHELSCSSCGAPLHDLKMLPVTDHRKSASRVAPSRVRLQKPVSPRYRPQSKRYRKPKRREDWMEDLFDDAWDLIEDIFD